MARLVILAQNVGIWPARFELFGYEMRGDLVIIRWPIFHFCSGGEIEPGAYYSYEAELETSYPVFDLHFTSEPRHGKRGPVSYGKGKFIIEELTWAGRTLSRPIIMHAPAR